jgi:predicted Zn-dependent protease
VRTSTLRLLALGVLLLATGFAVWLIAHRPAPQQPASLSVFVDRGTELMQAIDRVGLTLTRLSAAEEMELGRQIAEQVDRSFPGTVGSEEVSKAELQRQSEYVDAVVRYLVERGGLRRPEIAYTARVVRSDIANAFALPGGYVYITSSLFDRLETEAELAAIMGHEVAHVDLKHCIERLQYELVAREIGGAPLEAIVAIGAALWSLGYADEQEADADRQGTIYAERAGYHPEAAVLALSRLDDLQASRPRRDTIDREAAGMVEDAFADYFLTHPPLDERLVNIERTWREQHYDLAGEPYYLGRRNRKDLVPRSQKEFPQELITGRLAESTFWSANRTTGQG